MSKSQLTKREMVDKYYMIYWYRRHLDIAARDILGLELSPHHAIMLRGWGLMKFHNIALCSRGMGKSVLVAIYYTLISILYPLNKEIIVAPGFRQSKMVLLEVEKIMLNRLSAQKQYGYVKASLVDSKKPLNRDASFWTVQFDNGSIIYAVPLGTSGDTIRGLRSFNIACDEAFLIPSNIVEAVLEPMLNVLHDPTKKKEDQVVKSQSIKTSTIDFSFRQFYKEFKYYISILEGGIDGEANGKRVKHNDLVVFEFNFEDAYYTNEKGEEILCWGIDYQRLYEKKSNPNTNLEVWFSENKNIPADISGGYFPFPDMEACENVLLDEKLDLYPEALDVCSGQCILGIDTAPSSANSAFVVIKAGKLNTDDRDISICESANQGAKCPFLGRNKCCLLKNKNAILYAHEENKMSQKNRVKLIYDLMSRFNIIGVAMDARGGGYELSDLLKDEKYIQNVIGPGNRPIYDFKIDPHILTGSPILKLYSTTQDMNMVYNAYLKGLISNKQLLIPRTLQHHLSNKRLYISYGHLETLVNQLVRIKAIPAGKGLRFDIDTINPKTGKKMNANKDIYSALTYAVGRLRELIEEVEIGRGKEVDLALPKAFNL